MILIKWEYDLRKVFLGLKYSKTQGDFSTENEMCNRISFTRSMENAIFRHSCLKAQGHIENLVANQCITALLTLPLVGLILLLKSTMCAGPLCLSG